MFDNVSSRYLLFLIPATNPEDNCTLHNVNIVVVITACQFSERYLFNECIPHTLHIYRTHLRDLVLQWFFWSETFVWSDPHTLGYCFGSCPWISPCPIRDHQATDFYRDDSMNSLKSCSGPQIRQILEIFLGAFFSQILHTYQNKLQHNHSHSLVCT